MFDRNLWYFFSHNILRPRHRVRQKHIRGNGFLLLLLLLSVHDSLHVPQSCPHHTRNKYCKKKKKAQICVCMCIRPWIYYVRERESTSGGAEGPDPEDFQAGAFLTWHFVKTLTNKHSFTVFTFYRMRIPNACNANDNWCSWLQVISQLSGAKLKQV